MKNPNKKKEAWVGDAALLTITKIVLIERYPALPIKYLMKRERHIIKNSTLTNYCLRNNIANLGCNMLELEIGKLIFSDITKAKEIIYDIIANSKAIHSMDLQELLNGELKPYFIKRDQEISKEHQSKAAMFNEISKSLLTFKEKRVAYDKLKLEFDKIS